MNNSDQNGSEKDSIMQKDSFYSSDTGEFPYLSPDHESSPEELKPDFNKKFKHANSMRQKSNSVRAERSKSKGLVRAHS